MGSGKWVSAWLLITSALLTTSQVNGDGDAFELSVWVGQEVNLQFGDNSSDFTRRLWKRGDEIWLFMNEVIVHNDRISSVNSSAIMRIVNVTLDDEGYYTCTAFTRPPHTRTLRLQVKEKPCEAPLKPVNGDYESDTGTYRTGDTIQYYCHRGHRLIGQAFRTCNGTAKQWEPDEPYCEPEYIGDLMKRMDGFEDKLNVIETKVSAMERRITLFENNTLETRDTISEIDHKGLATDNKSDDIESRLSSVVAAKDSFNSPISKIREHVIACPNDTEAIDQKTVLKCVTMQFGERNEQSVFESKWVIEDFNSKVSAYGYYYSSPFYQTVPGYKFRLRVYSYWSGDFGIYLLLLPGEYDDQLTWPVAIKYDLTVFTNYGSEVLHRSQPAGTCSEKRPTSATATSCYTRSSNWDDVWRNKKHILNDGSVVIKLYLYTVLDDFNVTEALPC